MGEITKIKCEKCEDTLKIYAYVSGVDDGKDVLLYSYLCKDCGKLTTIDINQGDYKCKSCSSKDITRDFKLNELKCKCGEKKFKIIETLET